MRIFRDPVALISASLVVIPIALVAAFWLFASASYTPSKILDFHPSQFPAKASESFFYSIGNELKYSDHIDPQTPTLFRGKIEGFLVSPDKRKIAIVGDGHLTIVDLNSQQARHVTAVDTIYKKSKPIGQTFFRDEDFQWSSDSNDLYLIKDEYYESKGSQLFSKKAELWKYSLKSSGLQPVLKHFGGDNYFFDSHSRIYFDSATSAGDLILNVFDGSAVKQVPTETVDTIPTSRLASSVDIDSPFYSYEDYDYVEAALRDVDLIPSKDSSQLMLKRKDQVYITLSRGRGIKGAYYCLREFERERLLPGDRFLLVPVSCQNFDGQLLIDLQTGLYQTLPKETRAYITLNTETYPHFHIGGGGLSISR